MDRKLSDYLPYVIRDYDVMQELMNAEQPEFDLIWDDAEDVLDNQFVVTAGNMGLSRLEEILGITPKGTDSIQDRRFRVLSRFNEELPYTLRRLRGILETLCGVGNYSVDIAENTYILEVIVALEAISNFWDVMSLLERLTPVNLVYDTILGLSTEASMTYIGHWMHTGDNITLQAADPEK